MKEEKVKKRYTEKVPPDKTGFEKKPKVKYVEKEAAPKYISKEESKFVERENNPRQKKFEERSEKHQQKPYQTKKKRNYEQKLKREDEGVPKLQHKISSQSEDLPSCIICSEMIHKREPIWTCRRCVISLHLRCIKQWIFRSSQKKPNKLIYEWSCVQCNFDYSEQLPKYYCYCGKYENPEYERDLESHSCGKICQKKRGAFCPHLCPMPCHPGKCPPCENDGGTVNCHCGKNQRRIKCSEERISFQCDQKCGKFLNCGKHKCERNCHAGQCYPCKKKHMVQCHCGKNQDIIACAEESYACEEVCGKQLDCGFHFCEEVCHAGPCGRCQKIPELQKTCPCGRFSLMMLSINERESCKDPIPVCGTPCKKKLPCGHECPLSCHEGKCPDCKVVVQQNCDCGSTNRKVECYKTRSEPFRCDRICKKRKSCGQHFCSVQCCKFRTSPFPEDHKCEYTCQRMLNCGKHKCEEPCHAGLCKKCPVIYSQPQYCPCGRTSIKPPVVCGTIVPECDNICDKLMDCGHRCKEMCHYGKCICYEKVMVRCQCGLEEIQTRCGREALCLNKCQKLLPCGHKCLIQCHADSCAQANKNGCYRKCEKIRTDCGHNCKKNCHFGTACEDFICEAEVLIKCQCGHRQTVVQCGSSAGNPAKKKQISCNKKCENLKRFDILYKNKEIYYPNGMVIFGTKNLTYLQKLEQRLEKFILESDDHFIEVEFKFIGNNAARMVLHNLFESHYHLNTHFYRHPKLSSFTLMQTENTMVPKPTLSQYIKQIAKEPTKRSGIPFSYTIKFEPNTPNETENVVRNLKPFLHKYYIEKKQKMVLIHFWTTQDAESALQVLDSEFQSIEFFGEQNFSRQEEDEVILGQEIEEIEVQEVAEEQKKEQVQLEEQKKEEKQKLEQKHQQQDEKPSKTTLWDKIEEDQSEVTGNQNSPSAEKEIKKGIEIEASQKPKIIKVKKEIPKIIIRKAAPNFNRSEYPPSKENVQDIYQIDNDQLYDEVVNWDSLIKEIISKKMGIEASEWRIRSLLMINRVHPVEEETIRNEFLRIFKMYEKDKEKAKRILEIQKVDIRKIKQEMQENQIYLSDHEPEIVSYAVLYSYLAKDKLEFIVPQQCQATPEIQKAISIINSIEDAEFENFYDEVKDVDYVMGCLLINFIHEIRQVFLKKVRKHRVKAENLWKWLFFNSQDEVVEFCKANNLIVEKAFSKSKKEYYLKYVEGELPNSLVSQANFIENIEQRRDNKFFLEKPEELIKDKYMTRSFFAFGDFKETISGKYMLALGKKLRDS